MSQRNNVKYNPTQIVEVVRLLELLENLRTNLNLQHLHRNKCFNISYLYPRVSKSFNQIALNVQNFRK